MNTDTPVSLLFLLVVRCGTRPTTQSVLRLVGEGHGGRTMAVAAPHVCDLLKGKVRGLVQVFCLIVVWCAVAFNFLQWYWIFTMMLNIPPRRVVVFVCSPSLCDLTFVVSHDIVVWQFTQHNLHLFCDVVWRVYPSLVRSPWLHFFDNAYFWF